MLIQSNTSNTSKTLKNNLILKTNTISDHKLVKIYIKALKIYINNLTSYKLKWDNKKLITTIKNKPLTKPLTTIKKKINIVTKNESLNEESIKPMLTVNINNNNLINKPMNKNKQEFFNNIELLLKAKKEREINKVNTIIKNKPLILNKNSISDIKNNLSDTTNKTQNISNYLKSITIFNSIPQGKVFTFSQQLSYNFNTVNNKLIKKLYTFLFYSFFSMNSLISKPILDISINKIIINLFYFQFDFNKSFNKWNNRKNKFNRGLKNKIISNKKMDQNSLRKDNIITRNHKKLEIICKILSIYFNKPVELHLVKLNYPYLDSNIFVNLLALMINNRKVRIIMKKFFRFAVIKNIAKLSGRKIIRITKIPSFLSGIKIRIAGRLLTHKVVPKKTVKIIRRGAFTRGKINFLDIARYTGKNKRGAFTITVTAGQNLII